MMTQPDDGAVRAEYCIRLKPVDLVQKSHSASLVVMTSEVA
jgi:hypothetical protein